MDGRTLDLEKTLDMREFIDALAVILRKNYPAAADLFLFKRDELTLGLLGKGWKVKNFLFFICKCFTEA
jgi:hypothetical protein